MQLSGLASTSGRRRWSQPAVLRTFPSGFQSSSIIRGRRQATSLHSRENAPRPHVLIAAQDGRVRPGGLRKKTFRSSSLPDKQRSSGRMMKACLENCSSGCGLFRLIYHQRSHSLACPWLSKQSKMLCWNEIWQLRVPKESSPAVICFRLLLSFRFSV